MRMARGTCLIETYLAWQVSPSRADNRYRHGRRGRENGNNECSTRIVVMSGQVCGKYLPELGIVLVPSLSFSTYLTGLDCLDAHSM